MMKLGLILSTVIALLVPLSECANILGIFPMPGISHNILTTKLMKGLIAAGHNVTVISAFPMKDVPENGTLNEIVLEGFVERINSAFSGSNSMFAMGDQNMLKTMSKMKKTFLDFSNDTFYYPEVQKLLKSDQKFDAVVLEQFMNDELKIFAHVYECPLIILNSMGANSWVNSMVGNDAPVSYAGNLMKGDFSKNLSLYNRATNLLFNLLDLIMRYFVILPSQEALMREWYPDSPPLQDLYTNVSLVLLNSHTSLYPALPLVPNMVEIGGYFIDPPKKLPADLQEILDKSPEGVIYFSMGSVLKSKEMPEEKKEAIIRVLGKLKMKVLWKFEEDLPNKPNNVIIRKWFPQQDILAHPNIKLFITHGGLLSSTETIYHGVPVLAVPVFGDQNANADRVENNGFGLKLAFRDFTEEKFEKSINELLHNPKYRENVLSRTKIYHDRPEHPLKTAVYWIEYVIRHRGAPHLRVAVKETTNMDLLDSIMNSMDKPPSLSEKERLLLKKRKEECEKKQNEEKERLKRFKDRVEAKLISHFKDPNNTMLKFEPMDQIQRSIVHEAAEAQNLISYAFGTDGVDRYIRVYNKLYPPCEDELAARRRGEPWNEQIKQQLIKNRELQKIEALESTKKPKKIIPNSNYKDKYAHLIGQDAALDAAKKTETNKSYGFVPSENKKDVRSIEQTLADIKAKKRKLNEEQGPNA